MTLPGIAGFILTMGMGVDSNVLIFERIKEELEAQRGVRAAINAGFSRVFLTLLDTHTAALIAAAFLFQFGTGPIRGFAVTLSVGLIVEPLHLDVRLEDAVRDGAFASAARWRRCPSKPCISSRTLTSISCAGAGTPLALSWVIILAGLAVIMTQGHSGWESSSPAARRSWRKFEQAASHRRRSAARSTTRSAARTWSSTSATRRRSR